MPGQSRLGSARRIWTIARTEATRSAVAFDRRSLILAIVVGALSFAVTLTTADRGFDFQDGLYRVSVDSSSILAPIVAESPLFQVVDRDDEHDIRITGNRAIGSRDPKAVAGLAALRDAAKGYTFNMMQAEPDDAAAFPVRVVVEYVEVDRTGAFPRVERPDGSPPEVQIIDEGGEGAGPGEGTASGESVEIPSADAEPSKGFDLLPSERTEGTPTSLSPPFPFRSLVLAYAFLIPMNFVVQIYAGSAMSDRLQRRGEALLASPARPSEIIVGKALPYFAGMMLIGALIAFAIGGGWLSVLAIAPIALAFLATEFAAAMFARSFRELTFLTVFASVGITIYCFLPAVFADVHPVSLVSPITLVVLDLKGKAVSLGEITYALAPLTLMSIALVFLASGLYREEDLFHQKRVGAKALDTVAVRVSRPRHAMGLVALMMPFVLVAELLLVTFLQAWPVPVSLGVILIAVALVEETFKAAPAAAGYARNRLAWSTKTALATGAFAGLGFFLTEKGFLLASLVGLFDVPAGSAVFGAAGGFAALPAIWPLLLLGPLVLHVVTSMTTAWGARYGRQAFIAAFITAVLVHASYNYAVVRILGAFL